MDWMAFCLSCCLLAQGPQVLGRFDERLENWTFSSGPEFPGAAGELVRSAEGGLRGKGAACLRYDFTGGGAYVAAYVNFVPQEVGSFTLWVKKPPDAILTFRVTDSTHQTVQKSLSYPHGDWQKIHVTLAGWTGFWGGANDGRVHQPVSQFGILVERRGLSALRGAILFDEVAAHPVGDQEATTMMSTYRVSDVSPASGWSAGGPSRLQPAQWQYALRGGATAAWLSHSLALLAKPVRLMLHARGGVAGHRLLVRLGSHFQEFERELGVLTGGEVHFSVPMPPEGWRYFGGENDGIVRYPLRVTGLIVKRGDGPEGEGVLTDMELEAVTEVPARRAVTLIAHPGARPVAGASCEFSCTGWNLGPQPLAGQLYLQVYDWEGRLQARQTKPWTLPACQPAQEQFTVALPAAVHFAEARFTFSAEGQFPATAASTYTAEIANPGSDELQPGSPWGMGVYLYRYPNTAAGLAEMARVAERAQAAGVKWTREEFQWARIEPQPGRFEWSFYDRLVETAHRHGISVYGLLAYWSDWTEPYTEKGISDYCRWAAAVAARYRGKVRHWEIYNEPNIFFWSGPRELYPVLLKRAYAAIKEVDPEAQVLGCSTAGVDLPFVRLCLDADAPFDVLTIHPYRGELREAEFIRELREAKQVVDGRPVWITEMGWPTEIGATTEADQARLLARCYLTAVGSGACANISWYDFRNDGEDPFYNEHNFGVLRRDFSPKPAYRALASICRLLPGARDPEILDLGEGVWGFYYQTDDGPVCALWAEATRYLRFRLTGERPAAVSLMGESVPLIVQEGAADLLLTAHTPLLLRGVESLTPAGEPLHLLVPQTAQAGSAVQLEWRLPADGPASLEWKADLPEGWQGMAQGRLQAGEEPGRWLLQVSQAVAPGRYLLPVYVTMPQGEFVWPVEIEVMAEEVEV